MIQKAIDDIDIYIYLSNQSKIKREIVIKKLKKGVTETQVTRLSQRNIEHEVRNQSLGGKTFNPISD